MFPFRLWSVVQDSSSGPTLAFNSPNSNIMLLVVDIVIGFLRGEEAEECILMRLICPLC